MTGSKTPREMGVEKSTRATVRAFGPTQRPGEFSTMSSKRARRGGGGSANDLADGLPSFLHPASVTGSPSTMRSSSQP